MILDDDELAALSAEVARQGERINKLEAVVWHLGFGRGEAAHSLIQRYAQGDEWQQSDLDTPAPEPAPPILTPGPVPWASFSRAQQPAPPADAPLPGPVADAVAQMRASAGLLLSKGCTASAAALEHDADALAAWARARQRPALGAEVPALYVVFDGLPGPGPCGFVELEDASGQSHGADVGVWWAEHPTAPGLFRLGPFSPAQQPALHDDVREAMHEAAGQLDAAWNHGPTAYGHASQVAARGCVVCRLRELAGEP